MSEDAVCDGECATHVLRYERPVRLRIAIQDAPDQQRVMHCFLRVNERSIIVARRLAERQGHAVGE
jgi:hypothetical protein